MRIAMWSGPRNLSTAMMYSFASRDDFAVMDEPFYAPYLAHSGADHPMRDVILQKHETDPIIAARQCREGTGKPHVYMKHMPHHMLPEFPMDWAQDCVNVHLIRHPARVIASYRAKRENLSIQDIGFTQQLALYERLGGVVIDSTDIRAAPEKMLCMLCDAVGLPFDRAMLAWPAGAHAQDGAWAPHWYNAVHKSTGFAGPEIKMPKLDSIENTMLETVLPVYEALSRHRLK